MATSPPIPPSLVLLGFSPDSNSKSRLREYAAMAGWSAPIYKTTSSNAKGTKSVNTSAIVNGVRYEFSGSFSNKKNAKLFAAKGALAELAKSEDGNVFASLPVRKLGWCKDLLLEYASKMNYAEPTFAYKIELHTKKQVTCIVEVGGIWYIGDTKNSKEKAMDSAARSALIALQYSLSEVVEKPNEQTVDSILPCKRKEPESVTVPRDMKAKKKMKEPEPVMNVDAENTEAKTGIVSFADSFTNAVQSGNVDAVNTELVPEAIKIPSADNNLGPEVKVNVDAVNTELGPEAMKLPSADNNLVPEVKGNVDDMITELCPEAIKTPSLNSSLDNEMMPVLSANPNEGPDVKTGTVSFGDSSPLVVKVKKSGTKKRSLAGKNAVQATINTELGPEAMKLASADNNTVTEVKVNVDDVITELPSLNSSVDNEVMPVLSANPIETPDVKTDTVSIGDLSPQVVKVKKSGIKKRSLAGKIAVPATVNTELVPEEMKLASADNNIGTEVKVNVDDVITELPSLNSSVDNEVMPVLSVNPIEAPDVKTDTVSIGDSSPQVVKVKKSGIKKRSLAGKIAVPATVNTGLVPEAMKLASADSNIGTEVMVNVDAVMNTELGPEATTVLSANPNEGPDVKTGTASIGDSVTNAMTPQTGKVKKTRRKTKCVDAVNTELGPEATKIPSADDAVAVNTELGP